MKLSDCKKATDFLLGLTCCSIVTGSSCLHRFLNFNEYSCNTEAQFK